MASSFDDVMKTTVPLGFGDATASVGDHIGHFYRGSDQRFSVLGPYVAEGLRRGERCVVISSPDTEDQLRAWLSEKGLSADDACKEGRLFLHPGLATQKDMRAMVSRIEAESRDEGYTFVRWAGDGGWALAGKTSVCEMLRWEALYDKVSGDWQILALCQFDLTQFGGDVVMDALRSHPLCIMGDVLIKNSFHVSPDKLLQELSERE